MAEANHKRCPRCGETKPHSMYHRSNHTQDGCNSYCKPCSIVVNMEGRVRRGKKWMNEYARKRRYGITPDDYAALLAQQNHQCAICGTDKPGKQPLVVDHCHSSGKVRGLLCGQCNIGLGAFKDDPDRMQTAINYLAR